MTTAVRILLCGAAVATVAHGVFTVFGVGRFFCEIGASRFAASAASAP